MVATASASDLKARYPEFDGVSDDLVGAVIAEAAPMVDDEWTEADQKPAIMALAAHLLAMEGWPRRVAAPNSFNPATAGREVLSRKVGDVSTQYGTSSQQSSARGGILDTINTTVYGRRFAQLLKLNAPAIGLV